MLDPAFASLLREYISLLKLHIFFSSLLWLCFNNFCLIGKWQFVEDIRDRWETTDNPVVHKIQGYASHVLFTLLQIITFHKLRVLVCNSTILSFAEPLKLSLEKQLPLFHWRKYVAVIRMFFYWFILKNPSPFHQTIYHMSWQQSCTLQVFLFTRSRGWGSGSG